MYRLFEAEFAVQMIRAEEKPACRGRSAGRCGAAGRGPGHAAAAVERLSFTYGDRPVELRRGLYHTATTPLPQSAQLRCGLPVPRKADALQ
jgi:GntR family transcriptional regulator